MAQRWTGKTKGKNVGRTQTREYQGLTELQQLWLAGAMIYCQLKGCAMFIGTPTTTGSLRINLYPGDTPCHASLHFQEDWAQEIPFILSNTFEEDITEADIIRAVPWLARKASEAPRDRKAAYRPSEEVDLPQKPS